MIDSRIFRQCRSRSVIEVRLRISWEYLRKSYEDNMGTVLVLDMILSKEKPRMALVTFKREIGRVVQLGRSEIVNNQKEQFGRRLEGMDKKDEVTKTKRKENNLNEIEITDKGLEEVAIKQDLKKVENLIKVKSWSIIQIRY